MEYSSGPIAGESNTGTIPARWPGHYGQPDPNSIPRQGELN
jgi:hypothetical protein